MKLLRLGVAVVLACAVPSTPARGADSQAANLFAGRAAYASNGEPVGNATVFAFSGNTVIATTVTNQSGAFILPLKADKASLQAVDRLRRHSRVTELRPSTSILLRVADPEGHQSKVFGDAYGRAVLYATNRAADSTDSLLYGDARDTSVKKGTRVAWNVWDRRNRACPGPAPLWTCKPQSLAHGITENGSDFGALLAAERAQSQSKRVLVFVHGFSTSFEDALQTAALISFNGYSENHGFDEAVVPFAWPARGMGYDYFGDISSSSYSVRFLVDFLTELQKTVPSDRIDIAAHSMGGQLVFEALQRIAQRSQRPRFGHLFLIAPDVDAQSFAVALPEVIGLTAGIHVYASRYDHALVLSACLNGINRLGLLEGSAVPAALAGIELINASNVNPGILNHTYISASPLIGRDIANIITGNQAARNAYMRSGQKPKVLDGAWAPAQQVVSAFEAVASAKICERYKSLVTFKPG